MDILSPLSIFVPFDFSGGAAPPAAADLAAAVAARAEASAPLMGLATGGVYNGQAKAARATRPYVVFQEVAVTPVFNSGGRGYYEIHDVRVTCHETEAERARALGDRVLATFPPGVPLPLASGYLMSFLRTGGATIELPGRGKDNERLWIRTMTFRAKVGRALP